jgi:hypothetical protein
MNKKSNKKIVRKKYKVIELEYMDSKGVRQVLFLTDKPNGKITKTAKRRKCFSCGIVNKKQALRCAKFALVLLKQKEGRNDL